jgi:hypothetical protein
MIGDGEGNPLEQNFGDIYRALPGLENDQRRIKFMRLS